MELTAPVDVLVDVVPNSADQTMPKRSSLPSMEPPVREVSGSSTKDSKLTTAKKEMPNRTTMAPSSA